VQQPEKKSMHWAAAGWQLFDTYCYHWKLFRQIRILKHINNCIESSYGCSLSDLQSLLCKGLPLTGTAEIFHTHTHRQAPAHTCRHTHHLCRHTHHLCRHTHHRCRHAHHLCRHTHHLCRYTHLCRFGWQCMRSGAVSMQAPTVAA